MARQDLIGTFAIAGWLLLVGVASLIDCFASQLRADGEDDVSGATVADALGSEKHPMSPNSVMSSGTIRRSGRALGPAGPVKTRSIVDASVDE